MHEWRWHLHVPLACVRACVFRSPAQARSPQRFMQVEIKLLNCLFKLSDSAFAFARRSHARKKARVRSPRLCMCICSCKIQSLPFCCVRAGRKLLEIEILPVRASEPGQYLWVLNSNYNIHTKHGRTYAANSLSDPGGAYFWAVGRLGVGTTTTGA